MKYEYKFIKVEATKTEDEVNTILNKLGGEGWRLINFHPTSDEIMGKKRMFRKIEPWDVGYVFTFVKES